MKKKELNKGDLRVRRTHKLLLDALLDMLQNQSFDKISVTDICERAMVHRTTFYKHFEDKYSLLMYGIQETQKRFDKEGLADLEGDDPREYYMNILRKVLENISSNRRLHSLLFSSEINSVSSIIHKLVAEDIKRKLKHNENLGAQHAVPITIVANFYAGALIALVSWWYKNNMPVTIDEMVSYVDLMINNNPFPPSNCH